MTKPMKDVYKNIDKAYWAGVWNGILIGVILFFLLIIFWH
jgi:Mg/Co/Ni transporter MgtE